MSKNIYQRMAEVQKKVTTVFKNETVKMSENDKGYKAVTHDDVAAALHVPLAEAGVFMLPDIVSYKTDSFEKTNQWGKTVTWYRTDIEILVKWINIDNPEDFFTSKGAAFALDTSDKSFAKAYSLALKIVLLKVHLLESKDNEEARPFDESQGGPRAGKGEKIENKSQTQQNPPPQKKIDPLEFIMPFGDVKGKKLSQIPLNVIAKIDSWLDEEIKKKPKNVTELLTVSQNIKTAIKKMQTTPLPGKIENKPEDENQKVSEPEKESQSDSANFIIDIDFLKVPGSKGRQIQSFNEKELKTILDEIPNMVKDGPLNANLGKLFNLQTEIKSFLRSVGVEI